MPGPAPGEGQEGPRRHPWRRFHHHASEH
jgi:hypothetical protein